MHDSGAVDDRERGGHVDRDLFQFGARQRAATDRAGEGGAGNVVGDQIGRAAAGIGVADGGGAEPGHPAGGFDFSAEPEAEFRVVGEVAADHLDGDRLPLGVGGEVDDAHASGAESAGQGVGADVMRVVDAQR